MNDLYKILLFMFGCFVVAAIFFGTIEGVKMSFSAKPQKIETEDSDYINEQKRKMQDANQQQRMFSNTTVSQTNRDQKALMEENRRKQEDAKRAMQQKMMDYRRNR